MTWRSHSWNGRKSYTRDNCHLGPENSWGPLIGMESCLHGLGMHSVLEKIRNSRTQARTKGTNIRAYSLSSRGGFLYGKMVGGSLYLLVFEIPILVSFRVGFFALRLKSIMVSFRVPNFIERLENHTNLISKGSNLFDFFMHTDIYLSDFLALFSVTLPLFCV